MQLTLTATSSVSWSFISISLHGRVTLVAIITPPCPSFRSFQATMWWLLGSSSEFKMFDFSHVSVPIIMSGSELFIRFSNTSRLLQMLWKLIVSTFSSFIFLSTNFFGDDECNGQPRWSVGDFNSALKLYKSDSDEKLFDVSKLHCSEGDVE